MNLKPLGDRVVVEREEAKSTTAGGIVLPDTAKDKPQKGKVLAVGDGRITKDGRVAVDGNLYSGPDTTRRRPVEVHSTANEVRILEDGDVIATHPVLDGRGQRRIIAGHRTLPPPSNSQTLRDDLTGTTRAGDVVALRPLAFYDAVGQRLAANDAVA